MAWEKANYLKRLGPFGASVLILVSDFPPSPTILFSQPEKMFKGLAAAGLLIGLVFGLYMTNKHGYLQPKRKGLLTLALFVVVFVIVSRRYFDILPDAENHYNETVCEFLLINMLIGFLLFLVGPAIRLIRGAFGEKEETRD